MKTDRQAKAGRVILEIIMVLLSLVFLYPLLLAIINSLKSFGEVMTDVVALPKHLVFANYSYVWSFINYPKLFLNNFVITSVGLLGIVLVSSIAAYKLARTKTRWSGLVYLLCYNADAHSVPIYYANRPSASQKFASVRKHMGTGCTLLGLRRSACRIHLSRLREGYSE